MDVVAAIADAALRATEGTETSQPGPAASSGGFEGAERYDRALASWAPPLRSPDADVLAGKNLMDARSLDTVRNDAYGQSGTRIHQDLVVGHTYRLNCKPNLAVLGLDETWSDEFAEEVEALWDVSANGADAFLDVAGRNTLTEQVRLGVGIFLHAGENVMSAEWLRDSDRPFRTAVKMISPDRLCDPENLPFDRSRVRGGVRMNAQGRPISYYIRNASRGEPHQWRQQVTWSQIRARNRFGRPNMLHIVEQKRAGQTRGVSQLVAALKEWKATRKFRDITLQNAVLNASYAASVESELPSADVFSALGGGNLADQVADYAGTFLNAIAQYSDNAANMKIDGVQIPHLLPGTKLTMHPMGKPGGVGSDFEASLLRYIAADLDVSYEELSRDYTKTNYSSAKAALNQTRRAMASRKKSVADRIAQFHFRLWFEEVLNAGMITTMNGANMPNFYEGMNLAAYTTTEWIGAGWGQIDELKETQAAGLRVRNGFSTFEQECGRMGFDWRAIMRQKAREQKFMDSIGVVLPHSDADNAVSGEARETEE